MAAKDFFSVLPSEITIAILSRLSPRAVALSKCVRKAWQDLLASDYFLDSYPHSISAAAALAVTLPYSDDDPDWCKVFEVEDGADDLQSNNPMTEFGPPYMHSPIAASANGLIILNCYCDSDAYFVYNPITREYIQIWSTRGEGFTAAFGFGASKVSGEHKVVRIVFESDNFDVYTLGTGRWRRLQDATSAMIDMRGSSRVGVFLDGNIYWKVVVASDPVDEVLVVCFDVETESFSTVPPPPVRARESYMNMELCTLRDCLCFLDYFGEDGIGVWLMKEYCGVEKSWRKEYVIKRHPGFRFEQGFRPIKVFENGDILVLCDEEMICCYSSKTKTYQEIQSFGAIREGEHICIKSFLFTPSFRSLKRSFCKEKAISF